MLVGGAVGRALGPRDGDPHPRAGDGALRCAPPRRRADRGCSVSAETDWLVHASPPEQPAWVVGLQGGAHRVGRGQIQQSRHVIGGGPIGLVHRPPPTAHCTHAHQYSTMVIATRSPYSSHTPRCAPPPRLSAQRDPRDAGEGATGCGWFLHRPRGTPLIGLAAIRRGSSG
jgi:hypothetical protein